MTPLPPQQMTVADAFREAMRLDGIGRYGDAQEICRKILKARPDQVDTHHLMGVIAIHAGRHEDAIRHLKQTLKLKPDMPEAAFNLSKVYRLKGKWRETLATLETVHTYWPDRADIITDIGYAQEQVGDEDAAAASYKRSLQIDPASALAHSNLGAILTRQGAIKEAEAHLTAALASEPTMFAALMNLALLHDAADRRDEVIATYDRLLESHPDQPHAHFQRALAILARGKLAEGWDEYLWRFRRSEARTLHAAFPYPFWQGEPLDGRLLLVWTEQGPGDEILLASMIPDLLERGAQLTLVCSPRLAPLFRRTFKDCRIVSTERLERVSDGDNLPDYQASFSHVGAVLRPSMDTFPARQRYLTPDPGRCQKLRAAYQAAQPGTKLIGIAWHSAKVGAEQQKSVALEAWAPILRIPGATFVSLQYGEHAKAAKAVRETVGCDIIIDKSVDPLKDIDGFAAQVAAMDHVVSVSNTTVHVAGALGIPTSTMIPASYGRIWYWFLDRTDSPWYPSMRLFRQRQGEGWASAIAAVAEDLTHRLGG